MSVDDPDEAGRGVYRCQEEAWVRAAMGNAGWEAVGPAAKESLELLWAEAEHLERQEFAARLRLVIGSDDDLADLVDVCELGELERERGGVLSVPGKDPAARWWGCPAAGCDKRVPGTYRKPMGLTHCPTHTTLALRPVS